MSNEQFFITYTSIQEFIDYHRDEENASSTIKKYRQIIGDFMTFANGTEITKQLAIDWESQLKQTHKITSVNTILTVLNGFFRYFHLPIKMKLLLIQKNTFMSKNKILSKEDYEKLIRTAYEQGDETMALLMQTLGSTGIRIGELPFITVEAAKDEKAIVTNKGKTRVVFLTKDMRKLLLEYAKKRGITTNSVFVTRNGKPIDRANIWRKIRKLGKIAGVESTKLFCHNFRRLFAVEFYNKSKDIAKLSDTLGHSSIETTKIYIMEGGDAHLEIIESLRLTV